MFDFRDMEPLVLYMAHLRKKGKKKKKKIKKKRKAKKGEITRREKKTSKK